MRKLILTPAIIFFLVINSFHVFSNQFMEEEQQATSVGMVIYSNDVETVWNAMRLANYSNNQGDTVSIFLLGKGVDVDSLINENEDLKKQVDSFLEKGGNILGCGTCLKSRKNNEPQVCTFSSLADLYALIRKNKIVLTF